MQHVTKVVSNYIPSQSTFNALPDVNWLNVHSLQFGFSRLQCGCNQCGLNADLMHIQCPVQTGLKCCNSFCLVWQSPRVVLRPLEPVWIHVGLTPHQGVKLNWNMASIQFRSCPQYGMSYFQLWARHVICHAINRISYIQQNQWDTLALLVRQAIRRWKRQGSNKATQRMCSWPSSARPLATLWYTTQFRTTPSSSLWTLSSPQASSKALVSSVLHGPDDSAFSSCCTQQFSYKPFM